MLDFKIQCSNLLNRQPNRTSQKPSSNVARHAPSNSNTQPWHIAIVSGEAREQLEKEILAEMNSGKAGYATWPSGGVGLKDEYKQRQYDCGFSYYEAMGIVRTL